MSSAWSLLVQVSMQSEIMSLLHELKLMLKTDYWNNTAYFSYGQWQYDTSFVSLLKKEAINALIMSLGGSSHREGMEIGIFEFTCIPKHFKQKRLVRTIHCKSDA